MSWIARACCVAIALFGCGPTVAGGEDAGTSESGVASTSTTTGVGTWSTEMTTSDADTTTQGDTATTTNDDGIVRADVGGRPIECDIFAQDCPRGEKCTAWANDGGSQWNATRCSPIDPYMGGVTDPCSVDGSPTSGIDNCDATTMCFAVDADTELGTCVAFCTGTAADPFCEDPSTTCLITNYGAISLCLPACDPLLQDCAGAQGCYPGDDLAEFVCTPDFSGDYGVDGDACSGPGPWFCDPGLACLAPPLLVDCPVDLLEGCCSPFCDLTLAPEGQCDTASGETCVPWVPEGVGPPQLDPVGVCRLPE